MDSITLLDGRTFRVEVNWNAIVAFLESSNRDDVRALAEFSSLKPSDLAGLLAASINEGESLEGRDANFTAKEIGRLVDINIIAEFIGIFTRHTQAKGAVEDGKKK